MPWSGGAPVQHFSQRASPMIRSGAKKLMHDSDQAVVPIHHLGVHSSPLATQRSPGNVAELYYTDGEPVSSTVGTAFVQLTGGASLVALSWVLFGNVGLALAIVYAAGYFGEQLANVLAVVIRIPPLTLMLGAGLFLRNVPGPWMSLVQEVPADWTGALRTVATAVIILRAGMNVDLATVRQYWFGISCLAVVPGFCETIMVACLTQLLFETGWAWALMAGFVHSAISPAVVVPAAISLKERRLGEGNGTPTKLLSATCIEVVLAIVGFSFTFKLAVPVLDEAYEPPQPNWLIVGVPIFEIVGGLVGGILLGGIAALAHPSVVESLCALQLETLTPERVSAATQLRRNSSFWLLLGLGILTVGASKQYEVAGGGALAVLVMSVCCSFSWNSVFSKHVSGRMADSWALVQRALFAAMGASVDIWGMTAFTVQWATTLVAAGLGVRCLAALLVSNSGGRHDMSLAERVFVSAAWIPKATIQAALASVPLDFLESLWGTSPSDPARIMWLEKAKVIQVAGALSILFTAPLGAFLIHHLGPTFLPQVAVSDSSKEDSMHEALGPLSPRTPLPPPPRELGAVPPANDQPAAMAGIPGPSALQSAAGVGYVHGAEPPSDALYASAHVAPVQFSYRPDRAALPLRLRPDSPARDSSQPWHRTGSDSPLEAVEAPSPDLPPAMAPSRSGAAAQVMGELTMFPSPRDRGTAAAQRRGAPQLPFSGRRHIPQIPVTVQGASDWQSPSLFSAPAGGRASPSGWQGAQASALRGPPAPVSVGLVTPRRASPRAWAVADGSEASDGFPSVARPAF